jgi:hypothetical protein
VNFSFGSDRAFIRLVSREWKVKSGDFDGDGVGGDDTWVCELFRFTVCAVGGGGGWIAVGARVCVEQRGVLCGRGDTGGAVHGHRTRWARELSRFAPGCAR